MTVARVVSGGQTGVDRAALDVALRLGLECAGWCPRGGWAEDLPTPPGLLTVYPTLREAPSADPAERTRLNVRDSDATLVARGHGVVSAGTDLTVATAREQARPCLVSAGPADEVVAWLAEVTPQEPSGLVLNVAGPRASEWPDGYQVAYSLLTSVLTELARETGRGPDRSTGQ